MALYKVMATGGVQRSDGACIPPDSGNADWREYLAWRDAGGTPDPADPPPSDPLARRVHPYYFRLRFAQAQRIAIATSADPLVIDLREGFAAADTIGLDDPRTAAGLQLLVARGLIAAGDVAALLADRRPDEKP
jgi:hypothetical protein